MTRNGIGRWVWNFQGSDAPPMEWTDEGVVLGVRRHGEGNAILELMTCGHGRHLGLVRGGGGSRLRPMLQPGNRVRATWRARLDEHLGNYTVEGLKLRAGEFLNVPHAVYAVSHLAALTRLLPERDPHPEIHAILDSILDRVTEPAWAAAMVIRFELKLLADLGFGLDLSGCALTGESEGLAYVSPKTGRAVTKFAGEPWRDRLFVLPPFLLGHPVEDIPPQADLDSGFALTGFFLSRHVTEPRGEVLPQARNSFIESVRRSLSRDRCAHDL